MRRLLFLTIAWLWLSPWLFASHTFQIPHLAGNGWKTLVTAYNEGDQPATVLFTQWNNLGARIREIVSTVPAHGQHLWTEGDILPEGIATVTTDAGKVCVKLTYQYGNSRSICEFSITPDFLGTQWLIPNAHRKTPGWFGMAAANHGERSVEVSVSALRDGLEIRRASFSLMPGRKLAALSGDLWGLDCSQVDAVLVRSEEPIAAPILISGNIDQSRHVYFTGRRLETAAGERRFYVPHVAGNSWTTEIVVYNSGPEPGTFSLHQYDDSGNEIKTVAQKVLPFGSATLSTGDNQLAGSGSALLTGRGSLSVKLSYRYGDSDSVCEFLVNGDVSRDWLLPNSAPWWLEWSGVALQNPGPTPVDAIIRAYKAGVEVRKAAITIGPRQKWAALLNQNLNLNPLDFDHLSVETNQPVPMPLAITGDNAQDRHVFFGGQALTVSSILKKWTYLFYSDAEFANGYNPTLDFALEAYSGPNLEVLVLEDTMTTPTTLYRVVTPGSLRTLEPPQEKNMGDSGTLYDFIMKAKTEYPAERYILAFYDHGSGWQGCCMDQTSNDRGLTMKEIESAVSTAGGVDLVLFTAPCLMGELESVYQLRDLADVYVGSEDLSGYIGWFGTIGFIRGTLETSPEIGSAELIRRSGLRA